MSLFPRFSHSHEFSPLFRLIDDYDRASRQAFRNLGDGATNIRSFAPKFDVRELKDSYELHGELPGIEQKEINIEWTDSNTLTISGRTESRTERDEGPQGFIEEGEAATPAATDKNKPHKATVEDENPAQETVVTKAGDQELVKHDENQYKYWVTERSVGEFHRSFSFPARVDQEAVKASLKNGILSIVVPKAQAPKPKKINIE